MGEATNDPAFGNPAIDPALSRDLLAALQEIARAQFAHERPGHTLQPTALVNELWLRILRSESEPPTTLVAFRAWAAVAIRNILISHARSRDAAKRGGGEHPVRLLTSHGAEADEGFDLLDLEDELILLEKHNSCAARVVELRYYGGMEHAEVAETLGMSVRSSEKAWALARAWLSIRLRPDPKT